MQTILRSSFFVLLATSAFTFPARSEELPPVVSAIFKSWETQLRATPAYDKIETDGSGNVTISNLAATIGVEDPNTTVKLNIGSITLENVAAEANGLIGVGTATFSETKV